MEYQGGLSFSVSGKLDEFRGIGAGRGRDLGVFGTDWDLVFGMGNWGKMVIRD